MSEACFECGKPSEHDHHVIPRVYGGLKTIPLCRECHGKIHGRSLSHADLTRAGLAAYKARGGKLGAARRPVPADRALVGSWKAAEVRRLAALEAYADLVPAVKQMRSEGLTLKQIAARLDDLGHTTRSGKSWHPMQVSRVLSMTG